MPIVMLLYDYSRNAHWRPHDAQRPGLVTTGLDMDLIQSHPNLSTLA